MNSDDIFWITFCKIAATVLCVAILSVTGCSVNKALVIERMIAAGVDPMEVACIFDSNSDASRAIKCNAAIKK